MSDLDNQITRYWEELGHHPPGDAHRIVVLINLANSLEDRFLEKDEIEDLDRAIVLRRRSALELHPAGHSDHSDSLHRIAFLLWHRYRKLATIPDLEEPCRIPAGRYLKFNANPDLEEAIAHHRSALDHRPAGHSDRSDSLHHLVLCLWHRYRKQATISDLDEAIALNRVALELRPLGHLHHAVTLNNLAVYLKDRFMRLGVNADLDEAISLHRLALHLRLAGHPDRSDSLNRLMYCLSSRFEKQGTVADLDELVTLQQTILEPPTLGRSDLAASHRSVLPHTEKQQQRHDRDSDLDGCTPAGQAIRLLREPGDSTCTTSLLDLASALYSRFQEVGTITDLEEAITLGLTILKRHPPGNSGHSLTTLLDYLGDMLDKYSRVGNFAEAVTLARVALALHPPWHPDHASILYALANLLLVKFRKEHDPADLDEAIILRRHLLALFPAEHPQHASSLYELSRCLSDRFEQRAMISDIDEAITLARRAMELRPQGHRAHALYLDKLILYIQKRLQKFDLTADVEELVLLRRAALDLCPSGHLDHATSLHNLAFTLHLRFRKLGRTADLKEAASSAQAVFQHCPSEHPTHIMSLHNLVICVRDMTDKEDVAVDEMVNFARAASKHCPLGHSDYVTCHRALETCLRRRFHEQHDIEDLDECIILWRKVLEVYPSRNAPSAAFSHELARCLSDRFNILATTTDLHDAIKCEQAALGHCPPGHPDHAKFLTSLTYYRQLRVKERTAIPPPASGPAASLQIKQLIGGVVCSVLKDFPPRLLDTHTGMLCNHDSQILRFEKGQEYDMLLSSPTLPSVSYIRSVVSTYFRYVTLSHRWGRLEPLLRDIEGQPIYDLDLTGGLSKLQSFCLTSCQHGYLWAWSDTCCIDKESSAEL
ncbi:hypothetical protein J3A83DRAFT_4371814 [Scleroderma citrinum]